MRPAAALLLLASLVRALDVPAAEAPEVDGDPSDAVWARAAALETPRGTARLLAAGPVLYLAFDMKGAYRGERFDLHVAADTGEHYSWHAFHPACQLPEVGLVPVTPVLVRRATWTNRAQAHHVASNGCVFRAMVYRSAHGWSAEIAIALGAIGYHPDRRMGFRLDLVHPGTRPLASFAPPQGEAPAEWERLSLPWAEGTRPFVTLDEDARRQLELELFQEFLNRALDRAPTVSHFGDAVLKRKNNGRVDALLGKLDACLEADPQDYFAHYARVRLLRHANRIGDAVRAYDRFTDRFPFDAGLPRKVEGRALLLAHGRFEAAAAGAGEALAKILGNWREEEKRRAHDAGLPRVRVETSKGPVVVELFRTDTPKAADFVLALVERKGLDGAVFDEVTGASHAAALPPDAREAGPAPDGARLTWRGHVTFDPKRPGVIVFATGHLTGPSVGRVLEGMSAVDALEAGDKIVSAAVTRR